MASNTLWISAWTLAFLCLLSPGCGDVYLREGQPCGRYISGHCETDLMCLPVGPYDEDSHGGGVCRMAPGCNCSEVQCPPRRRGDCRKSVVTDPCRCCTHCAREKGQVCGGPSWRWGYCENGLLCALVIGHELALPPQMGVCKVLPGYDVDRFADPLCPWVYGCNIHVGNCDCYSEQTCQAAFRYDTYEECYKIWLADLMYNPYDESNTFKAPTRYVFKEWSCEVQGCQCVCQEQLSDYQRTLLDEKACCELLKNAGCPNSTCPHIGTPPCPSDSFLTEPYTEPGHCCPLIPRMCTCDFQACPKKTENCLVGSHSKPVVKGSGSPGSCCNRYECVADEG